MLKYGSINVAFGQLQVAYEHKDLYFITADDEASFLAQATQVLGSKPTRGRLPDELTRNIKEAVEVGVYTGPLRLGKLTTFQQEVLEITARIPRGEVRSYAWVAKKAGRPNAYRAAASALARNPLPFIIPCHRVIHSNGKVGAYSGGGMGMKEKLLRYEGVKVGDDNIVRKMPTIPFACAL